MSDDRLARSGKASCRVPALAPFTAHAAPDAPIAHDCRLDVTVFAGANSTTPDVAGAVVPASGTSWIRLTTDIVPTDPATDRLVPRISSERVPEGGCLLIDDVSGFVVP